MLSAICFNLDQSKILSPVNGLNGFIRNLKENIFLTKLSFYFRKLFILMKKTSVINRYYRKYLFYNHECQETCFNLALAAELICKSVYFLTFPYFNEPE